MKIEFNAGDHHLLMANLKEAGDIIEEIRHDYDIQPHQKGILVWTREFIDQLHKALSKYNKHMRDDDTLVAANEESRIAVAYGGNLKSYNDMVRDAGHTPRPGTLIPAPEIPDGRRVYEVDTVSDNRIHKVDDFDRNGNIRVDVNIPVIDGNIK